MFLAFGTHCAESEFEIVAFISSFILLQLNEAKFHQILEILCNDIYDSYLSGMDRGRVSSLR
jgi:hypothetical protein